MGNKIICSECKKPIKDNTEALLCEEHNETFHVDCKDEHSTEKHNAYYREVSIENGKIIRI